MFCKKHHAFNENYKIYDKTIHTSFFTVPGKRSNLFPTTTTSFGTRSTSQVSITNLYL